MIVGIFTLQNKTIYQLKNTYYIRTFCYYLRNNYILGNCDYKKDIFFQDLMSCNGYPLSQLFYRIYNLCNFPFEKNLTIFLKENHLITDVIINANLAKQSFIKLSFLIPTISKMKMILVIFLLNKFYILSFATETLYIRIINTFICKTQI